MPPTARAGQTCRPRAAGVTLRRLSYSLCSEVSAWKSAWQKFFNLQGENFLAHDNVGVHFRIDPVTGRVGVVAVTRSLSGKQTSNSHVMHLLSKFRDSYSQVDVLENGKPECGWVRVSSDTQITRFGMQNSCCNLRNHACMQFLFLFPCSPLRQNCLGKLLTWLRCVIVSHLRCHYRQIADKCWFEFVLKKAAGYWEFPDEADLLGWCAVK